MAIPFTQDSIFEYFDEEGGSLRRAFLKAPLDFFRITSRFTNARFHPILKRYRAHHGVDYAAPAGTPVRSIGAGTVIAKGYEGGGGNFLKIRHNSVYTTTYMHLSRFAKGIQVGSHVQQGEEIAYVGSTGLSTGPHLDFRVYKNGEPIDPLKLEAPPSEPVQPALRDSFMQVKAAVLAELDSCHQSRLAQRLQEMRTACRSAGDIQVGYKRKGPSFESPLTSVNVYLFSVCVMMNKQLLRAFPSPNGYKYNYSAFPSPNSFDEPPENLNESHF